MSDRQYGVMPGTGYNGTPPPPYRVARNQHRSQSPLKQTLSPFRDPSQTPSPSREQQRRMLDSPSPQRRDHQDQTTDSPSRPPLPPVHRRPVATSGLTSHQDFLPTASSLTSSDVSSFAPEDSRSRALHGVDSLYSPRFTTPSPERNNAFHSPYQDNSPQARPLMSERRQSKQPAVPAMAATMHHASRGTPPPQPAMLSRTSYHHGDGYDDINPDDIIDDHDDIFQDQPPRSRSRLGLGRPLLAGGAAGALGGVADGSGHPSGLRDSSGQYQTVSDAQLDLPDNRYSEKSNWLAEEEVQRRRRKRLFIILGILLLIGIIVGAVVGGIIASRKNASGSINSSSSGTTSASTAGTHSGGLYDINSNEVQAVMSNSKLHKVFPGMDYTPLNSQYPDCLHNGPDQNNITLDLAVLSQLTPAVRLYGTDCNQTEMVLTAIDRLGMNDTMQVWLGVWLGNNVTTNARQLSQMYDILDKYPTSHFAGIIMGNEVLFREDLTLSQLSQTLSDVRTNLTSKKISLPLATSDLGDNWDAGLAATSDIVMANIHPFFAGVTPDVAPGWAWNFWQTKDSKLTTHSTGSWPKSIISEVGWPSEGGNDCGTGTTSCPSGQGAVASVDNMNKFMDGFVCQSLNNGTTFFWFSAFDEPWKAVFNTADDQWESKWGLMDVNRNIKSGLSIPDCGGKTVTKAY